MNGISFYRKLRPVFIVAILALMAFVALTGSSINILAQEGNWQAKYWNNRDLSGTPVLVRQESSINYDWGDGSPGPEVQVDNFSAQWLQTVNIPAGTYRFSVTTDDGMRVYVDNTVIIDSWYDSEAHGISADVYLAAGSHTVRVDYYEAGGNAVAKVSITLVQGTVPPPTNYWRGDYFNNTNLTGTPVLVRNDANINFNWGLGSPAPSVQSDHFSTRWTRTIQLDAGRYRFTTVTDDGVRLWVNGSLVIDRWQIQAAAAHSADIDIPGGSTAVVMEYFENTQVAEARLTWTQLSGVTPPPTGAWHAEYFNNTTLSGAPVLARSEQAINYNWGYGSPAPEVSVDHFSARWTTTISGQPGRYRFVAKTDDGVRVYVNDQMIIDGWYEHPVLTFSAEVDLSGSPTTVRVEYFEQTQLAEASVTYSIVGTSPGTGGPYPGTATVTGYTLNVRQGPGTQFGIVAKLTNGDVVPLTGYRNGNGSWVQIVLPNTEAGGWVSSSYIRTSIPIISLIPITGTTPPPPAGGPPTGIVKAYWLNVRTGPGTGYPVITTVPAGTQLSLLGRNNDATWLKAILPDGRQGWVSTFYVDSNVPVTNLPVLTQ